MPNLQQRNAVEGIWDADPHLMFQHLVRSTMRRAEHLPSSPLGTRWPRPSPSMASLNDTFNSLGVGSKRYNFKRLSKNNNTDIVSYGLTIIFFYKTPHNKCFVLKCWRTFLTINKSSHNPTVCNIKYSRVQVFLVLKQNLPMASSVPEKTARFPECLEHGVGALAEYGQVCQHPALRQDGQAAALELQVLRPEQYGFTSSRFSIADPHRIPFPESSILDPVTRLVAMKFYK